MVSRDGVPANSGCCGSNTAPCQAATQVTGWGGTQRGTGDQPDGKQVFRLDANFVYRAIPITDGPYTARRTARRDERAESTPACSPAHGINSRVTLEFDLRFPTRPPRGLKGSGRSLPPVPEASSPSKSMSNSTASPEMDASHGSPLRTRSRSQ